MVDLSSPGLQQEGKDTMHEKRSEQPERGISTAWPSVTRESLAAFLDLSPDALIVVDAMGTIMLINAQMETLFGYRQDELAGQPLEIVIPERLRAPHAARRAQYMQEARPRPMGVGLPLVGRRKDGSEIPVDISLRPILIGQALHVIGAVRDMTAQRLAEQALAQLEQKARIEMEARLHFLQVILDRLPFGVFLVRGPHLHLVMANRAVNALWGAPWQPDLSREDFQHQQGVRFLAADGRPLSTADLPIGRAMASGEPILHQQIVIRQPDGTCLPLLADAVPLERLDLSPHLSREPDGTERVVLGAYQDVSALKEAEALKDQFISLATHELRTPVTIVAGYADLLLARAARGKEHELDAWQSEKVQQMKQATRHLARLTEDLLDVSRIQAGQFQLEPQSTDLVALARRVISQLQATSSLHDLTLHTTSTQLWATVDSSRIEQVLTNLLSNAVKYSPRGGPVEVTLEENRERHEARFCIRDQGIGIPSEQQAHLFGRFVRARSARASGISGTGLGLYLCRELIEQHGGQIWFESEEGAGTTFFFSLPCTGEIG